MQTEDSEKQEKKKGEEHQIVILPKLKLRQAANKSLVLIRLLCRQYITISLCESLKEKKKMHGLMRRLKAWYVNEWISRLYSNKVTTATTKKCQYQQTKQEHTQQTDKQSSKQSIKQSQNNKKKVRGKSHTKPSNFLLPLLFTNHFPSPWWLGRPLVAGKQLAGWAGRCPGRRSQCTSPEKKQKQKKKDWSERREAGVLEVLEESGRNTGSWRIVITNGVYLFPFSPLNSLGKHFLD